MKFKFKTILTIINYKIQIDLRGKISSKTDLEWGSGSEKKINQKQKNAFYTVIYSKL